MEQPVRVWVPSIGISGMMIYTGDKFPQWRGNMFVGGMASQHLSRLTLDGQRILNEELLVQRMGRIRDIRQSPDGFIYLVTDDRERDWAKVRVAERRRMEVYNRFREQAGGHGGVQGIAEADRIPQTWVVGDVEHCVAELAAFIREYGLTDIVTWAVPPGMRPDETNPSLERFARDVAPRLRAMFGAQ